MPFHCLTDMRCTSMSADQSYYLKGLSKYVVLGLSRASANNGVKDLKGKVVYGSSIDFGPFIKVTPMSTNPILTKFQAL